MLDEAVDEDMAASEQERKNLTPPKANTEPAKKPKRAALPDNLPRVNVHHEPDSAPTIAKKFDRRRPNRLPMPYMSGCYCNEAKCPMTRPQQKHWITA